MIGNAPLSHITGVPGWESAAEQELLYSLAQQVPDGGVIVEIGGEFGMSSSLFCKGAREGVRISTVDLFPGELLIHHRANLAEAGLSGRSEQIRGHSADVLEEMGYILPSEFSGVETDGAIDLLFIDGDHSYEGVLADLKNWTPFVRMGGVVVLHDVAVETNQMPHPLHFEVKRALDDWQAIQPTQTWTFVRSVDSTVVLRHTGVAVKWETPQTTVYEDGSFEVRGQHPLDDEPVTVEPIESRYYDNPPEVAIHAKAVRERVEQLQSKSDDVDAAVESPAPKAKPAPKQTRSKERKTRK